MINLSVLNEWLPLIISVLAIVLSLYWFWTMHGRMGRLVVSPPRSFKSIDTGEKLMVELPLVFYNDGAAAIVVDNLMLLARQEKLRMLFRFEYTRDELDSEAHHWATQLALPGKQALAKVFSFQVNKGEESLSMGTWDCTLMAKLHHEGTFRTVSVFKLNVSRLAGSFSAIDNTAAEYQTMLKRYILPKK